MQVTTLAVGILQANCYLVHDDKSRQALIVDPGDEPETILRELRNLQITARGILLTHAHVDHIRGIPELVRCLAIPVLCHPADRDLYFSPANALPPWLAAAENLPEPKSVPENLPGLSYRVLETPGHTRGGVCYHFAESAIVFTGDTLFRGSIGRTDLPGGNPDALRRAIRDKLLCLPPETIVYPGHGEPTTIHAEAVGNPYLATFKN